MIDKKKEFKFYTKIKQRENVSQSKKITYTEFIKEWITFLKERPHRFIQDYFQIRLNASRKFVDRLTQSIGGGLK